VVLTGSLLRSGDRLRVSTQLTEVPAGTLLWAQTSEVVLGDMFQIQDELATRIVDSLALPLTAREHTLLKRDSRSQSDRGLRFP
jgi:eukaryotic-like serine/threonine-protein kinase